MRCLPSLRVQARRACELTSTTPLFVTHRIEFAVSWGSDDAPAAPATTPPAPATSAAPAHGEGEERPSAPPADKSGAGEGFQALAKYSTLLEGGKAGPASARDGPGAAETIPAQHRAATPDKPPRTVAAS